MIPKCFRQRIIFGSLINLAGFSSQIIYQDTTGRDLDFSRGLGRDRSRLRAAFVEARKGLNLGAESSQRKVLIQETGVEDYDGAPDRVCHAGWEQRQIDDCSR